MYEAQQLQRKHVCATASCTESTTTSASVKLEH
jgi:hypothetical protein